MPFEITLPDSYIAKLAEASNSIKKPFGEALILALDIGIPQLSSVYHQEVPHVLPSIKSIPRKKRPLPVITAEIERDVRKVFEENPGRLLRPIAKSFRITVPQARDICLKIVQESIKSGQYTDGEIADKYKISLTRVGKIRRSLGVFRYGNGISVRVFLRERAIRKSLKSSLSAESLLKMLTEEGFTLEKCAARYNVSRERIRQIANELGIGDYETRRKPSWYAVCWGLPDFSDPEKIRQECLEKGVTAVADRLGISSDTLRRKLAVVRYPLDLPVTRNRKQAVYVDLTCSGCSKPFKVSERKAGRLKWSTEKLGIKGHYCENCVDGHVWTHGTRSEVQASP